MKGSEMDDDVVFTEIMKAEPQKDMNVIVAEAETRAMVLKMVLPKLVKVCHARNILNMGGNPYIDNDGCQKIARIVGITYSRPEITSHFEDDPDTGKRVYVVDVVGEASAFGQTIIDVGGATSDDKFFANRKESFQETRQEVRKKALANWQGRCVRALLGLKEMSWDELEDVGFKRDGAGSVDYRNERHSSGNDTTQDKDAADENRRKIREQISADVKSNAEAAADLLEAATAFPGKNGKQVPGVRHPDKLSEARARTTWNKIKPGGNERDKYEDMMFDIRDKYNIGPEVQE